MNAAELRQIKLLMTSLIYKLQNYSVNTKKAVELEKKIKNAQEIDKLTKEQGEGITTSQLEIDTSAINKMAEEYEAIMKEIYKALDFQNAQVELEKNIRESLEGAFA